MAVEVFDILSGAPPVSQISGSGTDWLVLEFQATDNTTGNSDTFYSEFGVPAAGSYTVGVSSGASSDPVTLSNAGFLISSTQIPLEDLNPPLEPPTGFPGSPFTPIPSLSGPLAAGSSESTDVMPEPGTGSLLLVGLMGFAVRLRRQKR